MKDEYEAHLGEIREANIKMIYTLHIVHFSFLILQVKVATIKMQRDDVLKEHEALSLLF